MKNKQAFTLIELLIVVLIIGILAAVAVPQYQKAVLKSRYSAMMPIGKAVAEGNEVYYMEHGAYASLPTQLDVSGQSDKYPDGTQVSMPQEEESLSYVLVTNDSVPNARYLVYQKHSPSFPDTTMCEAGDERTNELCQSLGGVTLPSGGNSLGNADWTAYLLSGDATGSNFCPPGATCNSQGEVTECPSGKTLKEGRCVACDIEHAATCSTTSYVAASCNEGYVLNAAGGCEVDLTAEKLQAVLADKCPTNQTSLVCTIKNSKVYKCDRRFAFDATGECLPESKGKYAIVYDPDGEEIESYKCYDIGINYPRYCYSVENESRSIDGGRKRIMRSCSNEKRISKEGVCSAGYGGSNYDETYDSHGNRASFSRCSPSAISTTTGECGAYSSMTRYDNIYDASGNGVGTVQYTCTNIKPNSTECLEWEQQ